MGTEGETTDLTAEVDLRARPERTDLHDPTQRREVEEALTTVPGVVGARLVPGYERPVDELHVLTDLEKSPKQAVRDLQTLLMARFGVSTDHRVISVVQLEEERVHPSPTHRVIIDRVGVAHAGHEVHAEVHLRDGEGRLEASSVGPATPLGRRVAIATATLAALAPLLDDEAARIDLEGCDVAEVLGQHVAIALIGFRTGRGQHTVAGSALVRDAEADAVARAVLDALNRTLADAAGDR